jgi:hypothetical protein
MKKVFKKIILFGKPLAIFVLMFFFDRKYLVGRHFEGGFSGYIFAFRSAWQKNILRLGKPLPWPTILTCTVSNPDNISFHPDDLNNFQSPGTYFQNFTAKIIIGRGSYIAPNVGIITVNHQLDNLDQFDSGQDVVIGEKCWIGMNAVVLPGVMLGNGSIVAAGSVVTKSFPEERQVIGGVPARVLKTY